MALPLPTAWLNGRFVPVAEARISPLDRGFLFADAVYEVIPVYDGRPFLLEPHLDRLERSLASIRIRNPYGRDEWRNLVTGLIRENGGGTAAIYLQVSRGADAGRDHRFPETDIPPTVFAIMTPVPDPHPDRHGIRAITLPDQRWARCDIKSTALLPNILARQQAAEAGAGEAILLRDGHVTEGSGSSVLIVEKGVVIRRGNGHDILPGTTIEAVLAVIRECGIPCREEPISEHRLRQADEIWISAATRGVVAVTELDGRTVGDGSPGPVWRQVAAAYEKRKRGQ